MTKMATLRCQLLCVLIFGLANAQFPNPFSVLNGGTGSNKNATGCSSRMISCAPWCSRSLDASGCVACHCQTGGMNGMGGMNPMSGGMNPMGMNPMNQMANMFPGLSGGQSPMTGGAQKQGQACPQAPTTCPMPQPWCQRAADENGCVNCLCGKDLVAYLQTLNGQTIPTTVKPIVTDAPTTSPPSTTSGKVTHAQTTSSAQSCLDTFYCTKLCDYGYKTDDQNCPLCECLNGTLIDTPVDATDPPGKFTDVSHTTNPVPIATDHVTSCPGIFDCAVICNNGYKTDSQGCPICACDHVTF